MKKYFFISLLVVFATTRTNAQLINQLKNINYAAYVNHPINDLLAVLPSGYTLSHLLPAHTTKQLCASVIHVLYPDNITLELAVAKFTLMDPCAPPSTWNVTIFRQEKMKGYLLYDSEGNCVAGCTQ